ncbi:MAG: sugar ABC transporter ATP-binding protein [Marinisporobacter sp.]|jgi:simple sugar transport system ATP-binding protein|nr:sugar ABC transporter ATP-binding protein [Marinisporobacter sp.]
METILEIKNLSKAFHHVQALKNVNLSFKKGEIHGIIGANGSGKSTLMNILFGNDIIKDTGGYEGAIFYKGKKVNIKNSNEAIKMGIGMIHQEFALIPSMSIAENIKICRENTYKATDRLLSKSYSFIDHKNNEKDAKEILKRLGINVDTNIKIMNLSTNIKQFVEIAREMDKKDLEVLVLDEPTAVLNEKDGQKLMEILKEISKNGTTILFISHRLEEIKNLCDRVSILRDGEVVATYLKEHISIHELARDMIGYEVKKTCAKKRKLKKEAILSFKDFSVKMHGEEIKQINLNVYKGEILGVTSLSGHGKLALGYGIMGRYPVTGDITYKRYGLNVMEVKKNIVNGLYVLPDDRKNLGLLMEHSVEENIIFTGNQVKNMFSKNNLYKALGFMNHMETKEHTEKYIKEFDIKCSSKNQWVRELSGGNQQKVCIARALTIHPEVLFIAEPTRGIDIAAKEKILSMLLQINRTKDTTMVIASSELEELKRICDRIAVLCEGKLFEILPADASDMAFALALSGEGGTLDEKL